jgi:hypothetical protein
MFWSLNIGPPEAERFIRNLVLVIWDFIDGQILPDHIISSMVGNLKIIIISIGATL